MQIEFQQLFLLQWGKYFPGAPLPIDFYYSDQEDQARPMKPNSGGHCLIKELARVRAGESLIFEKRAVMCSRGEVLLGLQRPLAAKIPWLKSVRMVENMDSSFLITHAWEGVRARLPK